MHVNSSRINGRNPRKPILLSSSSPKTNGPSISGVVEATEGSSQSDSDFDPEDALLKDPDAMIEEFVANWVATLPRDDLYALSLLLFHILQQEFLQLVYPASTIIVKVLNRSYMTIQKWRVDFLNNKGELPDFL